MTSSCGVLGPHGRDAGPGAPGSEPMTLANCTAASAASRPLFDGPSPARAAASSSEFVVRTPNVIGTPVACEAAAIACATADAR